jgi:CubicO group peptidase (beta-lactamase class C family)
MSYAQLPLPAEGLQPHGIAKYCSGSDCVASLWMYKKLYKTEPSSNPHAFVESNETGLLEKMWASRANALFESTPTIAMLLIEKNRIVFERYKAPIDSKTALAGFSMSKSVASLTVGKAACNGPKISLDSRAESLSQELAGTAQGDASVRQLLTMSSGGLRGTLSLGAWPQGGEVIGSSSYPGNKNIPRLLKDYGRRQVSTERPGEYVKPGEEFSYKNADYMALGLVLSGDNPGGFAKVFSESLAPSIRFEDPVYWVHDENGYTHTSTSFHATLRDWGRLAQSVLSATLNKSDDCYESYVKSATTTQIRNESARHGSDFHSGSRYGGYGYGFWTDSRWKSRAVNLVGSRGQRIMIDPKEEKIMIVFSTNESRINEVSAFFDQW